MVRGRKLLLREDSVAEEEDDEEWFCDEWASGSGSDGASASAAADKVHVLGLISYLFD